ncbi:hypothetical protein ACC674_38525, partial [Rhizobium ruizarguesonis]
TIFVMTIGSGFGLVREQADTINTTTSTNYGIYAIDPKPEPIVITKMVTVLLPPECRKVTPAISPKPDHDMTQEEIFNGWSAD